MLICLFFCIKYDNDYYNYVLFINNTKMKITITWTSQKLPDLLWVDFPILDEAKSDEIARVSIQNTSAVSVFIENGKAATVDWAYRLWPDREVEMNIANLAKLYFITSWADADIRIITT